MNLAGRWARIRTGGPEQLAATLGLFLAGFFLLPSSKSVNNVYYALVLAPALFVLRGADWRWLASSRVWRAAMLLLVYLTVSGLWSRQFAWGAWLREAKGLPYLGVYLAVLACVCARRPATFERLLSAIALAAVAGTVASAAMFYARAPWPARLEFAAAVYNANEAATIVGTAVMLVLFHILPASATPLRHRLWGACALVLMGGIALTGSRTPLVAALICVALGFALRRQRQLLLGYGLVVLAAGALLMNADVTRQALARGDSYRLAIWSQFSARVADKPWAGEGLLTDETTELKVISGRADPITFPHPHNVYLATTLYGGLPALGMLLVMIALALRQGWRGATRGEPVWLLLLLFALLCMLTDGDRLLNAPRAIWFYFWLPVGVLIAQDAVARAGMANVAAGLGPVAGHRTE
jgi:O-antigen ligase